MAGSYMVTKYAKLQAKNALRLLPKRPIYRDIIFVLERASTMFPVPEKLAHDYGVRYARKFGNSTTVKCFREWMGYGHFHNKEWTETKLSRLQARWLRDMHENAVNHARVDNLGLPKSERSPYTIIEYCKFCGIPSARLYAFDRCYECREKLHKINLVHKDIKELNKLNKKLKDMCDELEPNASKTNRVHG